MNRFPSKYFRRTLAGSLLVATLVGPAAALASQPPAATQRKPASSWARYNAATHTAYLTIISAYGKDTYNFNGASRGGLVVTVPLSSKVVVTFRNNSSMMPHALEVVKYTGSLPTGFPPPAPAFPGAASPNYAHGTPPGVTQNVTFVASQAGRYLLICPVHNHVKFGHWAWFIVSKTATTATAVVKR